jgi:hypothetical protein
MLPSVVVNPPISVTMSSPLPAGTVNAAYSQTLTASGGTAPLVWSVSSGVVPPGMSLSNGGVLSGTPTTATGSPFTFTALVVDVNSITTSKPFTVTISNVVPAATGLMMSGKAAVSGTTAH